MYMSNKKQKQVTNESLDIVVIEPTVINDVVDITSLPTTSAKIRYLHAEGFSRGQIALKTNKRYQHVRNVLITPLKRQLNANANANSKHAE